MHQFKKQTKTSYLTLDTEKLNPQQIKLLEELALLATQTMISFDEGSYFENSAELLKKASEVIHSAYYEKSYPRNKNIPYAQQAFEYAKEMLEEI